MKLHFIAIGGSIMHNLALTLRDKGHQVTGSDDEIFEPALSRLRSSGILPPSLGWFPERIHDRLDAVILGMHARIDNPELLKAQELKLPIYSFPAFLMNQSLDKQRIVIGGSHGKTTVTAMILHVAKNQGFPLDYLVGSQIPGFDRMVYFDDQSSYAVWEGDEYLSSPIEPVPKFHQYRPHAAVLTGIAWDHINVFPTFELYTEAFLTFIHQILPGGLLLYDREDPLLTQWASTERKDIHWVAYDAHPFKLEAGKTFLLDSEGHTHPVSFIGRHNMKNVEAARRICSHLGIDSQSFYRSIQTFSGAAKRLERIVDLPSKVLIRDFAHAPSKVKATTNSVKEQYPNHTLVAVLELHTFSSLNPSFLPEYRQSLEAAEIKAVCYNPQTLALKKLPPISSQDIRNAFGDDSIHVFDRPEALKDWLYQLDLNDVVLLMMSSGHFQGIPWGEWVTHFQSNPTVLE